MIIIKNIPDFLNKNFNKQATENDLIFLKELHRYAAPFMNTLTCKEFWTVAYLPTKNIIEYTFIPNTLMGKFPVYEKQYQPQKISFSRDNIFTILTSNIDNYFVNEQEAQNKCDELNQQLKNNNINSEVDDIILDNSY